MKDEGGAVSLPLYRPLSENDDELYYLSEVIALLGKHNAAGDKTLPKRPGFLFP